MVWNCSIIAATLLFGVSGKSKAFRNAGKTELSCKIIDADDEWIKICYTEKKDKQVVKLMRIENIESIEEQIFKACGENDRAEYGKKLLEYLSEQLIAEFGKGFDKSNFRKMRQFYCTFPIRDTLCPELSWSHYRVLIRINDEQALIDHLQHFLLELGRGFSFVARQKRFTLDGQDFFIDLVFYNYILKCFVLIDLKMGKLTHQDLGQMQMYVNYQNFTKKNKNENTKRKLQ